MIYPFLAKLHRSNLSGLQHDLLALMVGEGRGQEKYLLDYKEVSAELDVLEPNLLRALRGLVAKQIISREGNIVTIHYEYAAPPKKKKLIFTDREGNRYQEGELFPNI